MLICVYSLLFLFFFKNEMCTLCSEAIHSFSVRFIGIESYEFTAVESYKLAIQQATIEAPGHQGTTKHTISGWSETHSVTT